MKKGWETKRLGDVCEIIKGRKPALKTTSSNGDLPYLVAKVMRGSKEAEYASVKDRNSITVEESETIIICDGSNSGEVFTGFRGILSSTMGKIAKKAEIDDDYLRAFLASTFDVFNGSKTGAAIPHLDKEAMYQLQFPYPPLAEQQRIVGLLDEAFEGLATAKANAEKNLQNARALFESHLQSVFTQRGPGWVEKTLREICDFSQGVQVDVKLQSDIRKDQSQVRFLRIVDFTQGNEPERFIDNPGEKFLVCQSDISLVRYGASTGFVCRGLEGAIANNLFRVIPKDGHISNDFLYWFLKSPAFQDEIKEIMNGAAMPAISFGVINEITVAFPPQRDQLVIVSKLESFAEETQRLARLYERKHAALEALKKSLLHQAFTGEL